MKSLTVWLKQSNVTLYIGGDPSKGITPMVTTVVEKPQVLVDAEKNIITILETK